MPELPFRGDPYRVLGVDVDASTAAIKRRWRDLAREHHPDRAGDDRPAAAQLTARMARINAAWDLLRDPMRRDRFDGSAAGRRAREASARDPGRAGRGERRGPSAFGTGSDSFHDGPPPPPPSRPVTGRFDTSAVYHGRNVRTTQGASPLRGHAPVGKRPGEGRNERDLRASHPTGPVARQISTRRRPSPPLEEAWETALDFGRFRGHTLGQVAILEPTYVDWIARTITRDRDLVSCARVVRAEMDRQGVVRGMRSEAPYARTVPNAEGPEHAEGALPSEAAARA